MTASTAGQSGLHRLFMGHQDRLRAELLQARTAIDHTTLKGDASEGSWRSMLSAHLPRRYRVCRGMVVDCTGAQSEALDVIIHDAHFCPVLLSRDETCFIPAESVYAVFEAKQTLTAPHIKYAGEKVASVRALHRTSAPIVDRGQARPPREMSPILGGVLTLEADWVDGLGDSFKQAIAGLEPDQRLDLGCALAAGAFEVPTGAAEAEVFPAETALVAFFIRLVDRLQRIGTVPAIDWQEYQQALGPSID